MTLDLAADTYVLESTVGEGCLVADALVTYKATGTERCHRPPCRTAREPGRPPAGPGGQHRIDIVPDVPSQAEGVTP